MKKIRIEVVFDGKGHGNINIIPTDFQQWNISQSSARDFNLDPGDYSVTYLIATDFGGQIIISENGSELQTVDFDKGVAGGNIDLTV